jgi:hypothetical protein
VERGHAHDLLLDQSEQGQIAAVVDVFAPIPDDFDVLHPVLDEHAFGFRNVLEKKVKVFLVIRFERPDQDGFAVLQLNLFGVFLLFKLNAE